MAQLQATHKASDSLFLRAVSALVLAPIFLAAVWYGSWPFVLVIAAIAAAAGHEWAYLINRDGVARDLARPPFALGVVALLTGLVMVSLGFLASVLAGALTGLAAQRKGEPAPVLTGLGVLYLCVATVSFIALRLVPSDGLQWTVFLCVVVWSADIGAYVSGRTIGGPKLAPAISPAKTWAGLVGGAAFAAVAAVCVALFFSATAFGALCAIAILLAVTGQAGDLLESYFKRRSGADDSGWLIPGHGGVLDRVDALMASSMVLWVLVGVLGTVPAWP